MTAARAVSLLLFGLGLAGCAAMEPPPPPPTQPAIHVVPETAELPMPVGPSGTLAGESRPALAAFVGLWHDRGRGPLLLRLPAHARPFAQRFLEEVRMVVEEQGADSRRVLLDGFVAAGPEAELRFDTLVAVAPSCEPERMGSGQARNNPSPAFGCATLRNLAGMVADPADLVAPRPMGPADAARGSRVIRDYRRGQAAGAARGNQATFTISPISR